MTLQQFRYIVEIAKYNSISKAASALYVTQPSIPLAHLKSITLDQLGNYPYLTYQQDDVLLHFAEEVIDVDNTRRVIRRTKNDHLV